jgi:hypothetical protein
VDEGLDGLAGGGYFFSTLDRPGPFVVAERGLGSGKPARIQLWPSAAN